MASTEGISRFVRFRLENIEKEMMAKANLVTSVSEPMLQVIQDAQTYTEKLLEVRNGFDFTPIVDLPKKSDAFEILYAGSFYGTRKPSQFFSALKAFLDEANSTNQVQVSFFGVGNSILIPPELKGHVHIYPRIEHQEMILKMQEASAFLLIQPTDLRKGVFTGKLFDYLAVNRPILALVNPEDVAARLILDCNAGWVTDGSNIEGIKKVLHQAFQHWKNGKTLERNWDLIQKHHRKEQSKRIQDRLDKYFSIGAHSET
jgi:hypothetical protein